MKWKYYWAKGIDFVYILVIRAVHCLALTPVELFFCVIDLLPKNFVASASASSFSLIANARARFFRCSLRLSSSFTRNWYASWISLSWLIRACLDFTMALSLWTSVFISSELKVFLPCFCCRLSSSLLRILSCSWTSLLRLKRSSCVFWNNLSFSFRFT